MSVNGFSICRANFYSRKDMLCETGDSATSLRDFVTSCAL